MAKRLVRRVLLGAAALLVLIQAVPYGRAHENPPVTGEPAWPSARARDLARRACFDCHSHEVVWPWYSHVAPASWLVQSDVDEGRRHLNFSAWDRPQKDAHEAAKELRKGSMPLAKYVWLHPAARLDAAEQAELAGALEAIAPARDRRGGEGHGDE